MLHEDKIMPSAKHHPQIVQKQHTIRIFISYYIFYVTHLSTIFFHSVAFFA